MKASTFSSEVERSDVGSRCPFQTSHSGDHLCKERGPLGIVTGVAGRGDCGTNPACPLSLHFLPVKQAAVRPFDLFPMCHQLMEDGKVSRFVPPVNVEFDVDLPLARREEIGDPARAGLLRDVIGHNRLETGEEGQVAA